MARMTLPKLLSKEEQPGRRSIAFLWKAIGRKGLVTAASASASLRRGSPQELPPELVELEASRREREVVRRARRRLYRP